jgi:hypothetical protein
LVQNILTYQGATPLEEDEGLAMLNYDLKDNFFLQLVHVALKIRGDLIGMDGHVGLSVSEDDAINLCPCARQANMFWCPFSTLTDTVHYVLTNAEDFGLFYTH